MALENASAKEQVKHYGKRALVAGAITVGVQGLILAISYSIFAQGSKSYEIPNSVADAMAYFTNQIVHALGETAPLAARAATGVAINSMIAGLGFAGLKKAADETSCMPCQGPNHRYAPVNTG